MTYKNYNDYINILKTLAEKVIVTNFDAEDMSHDTSFDIWLEKLNKIKISNFNKLVFVMVVVLELLAIAQPTIQKMGISDQPP